jgi:CRISPR-associated protein Csa2
MNGFISISLRSIVNVESLNGIESIGNLSRHRTVPIVVSEDGGYEIRFVPAVSGESIAHAYQTFLVENARRKNLPVGDYSLRGEFLKFTDEKIMKEEGITPPESIEDVRRAEASVILKDIVCDVGGFLYAGTYPIKRTSRFQVGYMIPALADVKSSALEAQFHARHAASKAEKGKSGFTRYHTPYNIEVGSAVYTYTFNLDVDGLTKLSTLYGPKQSAEISNEEKKLASERPERVKVALAALADIISSSSYGAKRSRFLPNAVPLSAVASFSSTSAFAVSPGNSKDFIKETLLRSKYYRNAMSKLGVNSEIFLAAFDKEDCPRDTDIQVSGSLENLVQNLIEKVLESDQ